MEKIIALSSAAIFIIGIIGVYILKMKRQKLQVNSPKLFLPEKVEKGSSTHFIETPSVEEIINRATELKSVDINQSILLLQQVLKISNENKLSIHFKLANYYHYSGKIEEAYNIYNNLINELNINDVLAYNKSKNQILEKICILNYKNEEFENYLFNYCYRLNNKALELACQGEMTELKEIINNKNKLNYLSQSKINGCFKKLNIENWKRHCNSKLNEYFISIQDDLFLMARISKKIKKSLDKNSLEESLRQNEEFMFIYTKLNSGSFNEYYKNNILINDEG